MLIGENGRDALEKRNNNRRLRFSDFLVELRSWLPRQPRDEPRANRNRKMLRELKNHAYIDANNLYRGINSIGWKLDYLRFRRFLAERYGVKKAYLCIGFVPANAGLYRDLQKWGYTLVFKPTVSYKGKIKGNCDGELILQVMAELMPDSETYCDKIVIVSGDGDFASLVSYLDARGKLEMLLSPVEARCSSLLKKATKNISYLEEVRAKLEFNPKSLK